MLREFVPRAGFLMWKLRLSVRISVLETAKKGKGEISLFPWLLPAAPSSAPCCDIHYPSLPPTTETPGQKRKDRFESIEPHHNDSEQ